MQRKMNVEIIKKAQELYSIKEQAECFTAYCQGAKYAKEAALEKACEWLLNNLPEGYKCHTVLHFKRAMQKEINSDEFVISKNYGPRKIENNRRG